MARQVREGPHSRRHCIGTRDMQDWPNGRLTPTATQPAVATTGTAYVSARARGEGNAWSDPKPKPHAAILEACVRAEWALTAVAREGLALASRMYRAAPTDASAPIIEKPMAKLYFALGLRPADNARTAPLKAVLISGSSKTALCSSENFETVASGHVVSGE